MADRITFVCASFLLALSGSACPRVDTEQADKSCHRDSDCPQDMACVSAYCIFGSRQDATIPDRLTTDTPFYDRALPDAQESDGWNSDRDAAASDTNKSDAHEPDLGQTSDAAHADHRNPVDAPRDDTLTRDQVLALDSANPDRGPVAPDASQVCLIDIDMDGMVDEVAAGSVNPYNGCQICVPTLSDWWTTFGCAPAPVYAVCVESVGHCDPDRGFHCVGQACCAYDPVWPEGSLATQPACPSSDEDSNDNGVQDNLEQWSGVCDHLGQCSTCSHNAQCEDESSATVNVCESGICQNLPDMDGDGIPDATDNCPTVASSNQDDADLDGYGVPCDCNDHDFNIHVGC